MADKTMAEQYEPFYSSTPQRVTSSTQAVFGIKSNWPPGSVLDCDLDGKARHEEVPDEQDHEYYYVVYEDVSLGTHTFNSTVTYPDKSKDDLGKFRWEIVEATAQAPQAGQVNLEGTITGRTDGKA